MIGVSIVPGFDGVIRDVHEAIKVAKAITFPVMIKASAGGGGKGMRIAWNEKEIEESFGLASSEAKSSFGDDRMLIEKFIEQPRHVEVQLIADTHGNVVYLPERDCSIQRRNQKVVEEAPCPVLTPNTRKQMGEQAVGLARSVGYSSAGTVEFMLDKHGKFFFLEMNTRLQVEHPITELVTGLDLVELMIRVAAGEKLPLKQRDVRINGWAIESRVYAEDPRTYLPCIGTLERYVEPSQQEICTNSKDTKNTIRCDSGVKEGSEISFYYDPMICKLSVHAPTRPSAISLMQSALDRYVIRGLTHNIPLLREIMSDEQFVKGRDVSTNFLKERFKGGFDGHHLNDEELKELSAVASFVWHVDEGRKYASRSVQDTVLVISVQDKRVKVSKSGNVYNTERGKVSLSIASWKFAEPLIDVSFDNKPSKTFQYIKSTDDGYEIQFAGTVYDVGILTEKEHTLSSSLPTRDTPSTSASVGSTQVFSPMPGQIVSIAVAPGDTITTGSELLVVEAMKMQNVVKSPIRGKVKAVHVEAGQSIGTDKLLIEIEPSCP